MREKNLYLEAFLRLDSQPQSHRCNQLVFRVQSDWTKQRFALIRSGFTPMNFKFAQAFSKWVAENSLSIAFFSLFVIAVAAQMITGLHSYNSTLTSYGLPKINFTSYLKTGNFLDGVAVNWQAAILQLGCLIVFTTVLHQKGASHSLRTDVASKEKHKKEEEKEKHIPWLYRHSLSIAFVLLFAGAFVAHIVFATESYNETGALIGQAPVSIAAFVRTATFWFSTTETWEAEFIIMGVFLVLSIFLRQQGSAESKPVNSSDDETGDANK